MADFTNIFTQNDENSNPLDISVANPSMVPEYGVPDYFQIDFDEDKDNSLCSNIKCLAAADDCGPGYCVLYSVTFGNNSISGSVGSVFIPNTTVSGFRVTFDHVGTLPPTNQNFSRNINNWLLKTERKNSDFSLCLMMGFLNVNYLDMISMHSKLSRRCDNDS